MKRLFGAMALPFLFFAGVGQVFAAEEGTDVYFRAQVQEIVDQGENDFGAYQILSVRILDEPEAGKEVRIEAGDIFANSASHDLSVGDTLVIRRLVSGEYTFAEKYRMPQMLLIFIIFVAVALVFTRKQGIFAIAGLAVSVLIITMLVVPWIIRGGNPLVVGVVASVLIGASSMLLAHGIKKRTFVALAGTSLTMVLAAGFAVFAVVLSDLFGVGSEASLQVQLAQIGNGDFRGILLAGILIGSLGVLDDVTVAQATAVEELKKANAAFGWKELYKRGAVIGREHLLSMVNTLLLAYAGASLPLFLLFAASDVPVWVTVNSEAIAEEIIRTLVGSTALVFGVPITTLLAASSYGGRLRMTNDE